MKNKTPKKTETRKSKRTKLLNKNKEVPSLDILSLIKEAEEAIEGFQADIKRLTSGIDWDDHYKAFDLKREVRRRKEYLIKLRELLNARYEEETAPNRK